MWMKKNRKSMKAVPLIGIARHRLTIDGEGVTTLVAFHGCPLRCKYCLNPTSLQPNGVWESYNCNQLYEEVRKDELYFFWRVAAESHLEVENLYYKANLSGNSANSVARNGESLSKPLSMFRNRM